MAIIFYLISLVFSIGQLGRITLPNHWGYIYLYEILLLIIMAGLFCKFKFTPFKQAINKYKIIFIFFLWLLISYCFSIFSFNFKDNLFSFLYFLRLLFYPVLFLYVSRTKINKKILLRGIYIFFILTFISSFIQYFLYPDLRNLYYLGWDPHLNRMFGVFFDTSTAAAIYSLMFLYLFKNKKYFFSILPLICFVLTFSRSAYLVLGLTLLTNFLSKNYIKYVLLIIVISALIFVAAPKRFGTGVGLTRNFSIFSRINDYKNALTIWKKYPLTGIGYNRIEVFKTRMGILNQKENIPVNSAGSFSSSYLIILVTSGIIGLSLFLMSLWKIYINNKKIFVYLFFIGLLSFADNIILHPFIITILGAFILLFDS